MHNISDVDRGLEIDKILSAAKMYVENSESDCINCWAAKICGVCFSFAVKDNDFNIERKREVCSSILKIKHNDLVTYATIMEKNPRAFDFTNHMVIM